jgi:aromatic-L-amino-acid decarboxylase
LGPASSASEVEYGLDPENWDEFRVLGHRMLDEMLTNLQTIGNRRTNFPTEEAIRSIRSPLKPEGDGEEETYEVFKRDILPYTFPHLGPRFLGVVAGTGSPYGMLAEMLAGGVNSCLETMFS